MITRLWTSLSLWLPLWLSISISLGILPRVEAQEEASSSQGTLAELAQSVGLGPYRRTVGFDWDPIEDSKSYDLEITQIKGDTSGKIFTFNLTQATWTGKLVPGEYSFRVRSRDHRRVAGDWSTPRPFTVFLENVKITSPAAKSVLPAGDGEISHVKFTWNTVGGASGYNFELTSADGKTKIVKTLQENFFEADLPATKTINWKVSATSESGTSSENFSTSEFSILGTKLATPDLEKPENLYVRKLNWKRPSADSKFDISLSRYLPETKKWDQPKKIQDRKENSLDFEKNWPGGYWKVTVRAKAPDRQPSDLATMSFKVIKGDRSPAAEYVATVKKSIDRINGWYGIASYLLTMMSYQSLASFDSAVGGTGRLGLGWYSEKSAWGSLTTLDLSGFIASSKNYTFASLESVAIHRLRFRDSNELRSFAGVYMKELPVLLTPSEVAQKASNSSYQANTYKVAALGPLAGFEYWYSLTPKLGFQLNTCLYYSMLGMNLPNGGQSLVPQLSSQFGVLGSYRVTNSFTGLTGLTYRTDKLSYTDNYATRTNSPGIPNQVDVTVKGLYLHFFAEVSF
jgi:hypothetical protein